MASMSAIFAMIFMLFTDTILSNYLLSVDVPEKYVGFVFSIPLLFYIVMAPVAGWVCKFMPKIFMTQFSFLLGFGALLMLGPSEVLGFP